MCCYTSITAAYNYLTGNSCFFSLESPYPIITPEQMIAYLIVGCRIHWYFWLDNYYRQSLSRDFGSPNESGMFRHFKGPLLCRCFLFTISLCSCLVNWFDSLSVVRMACMFGRDLRFFVLDMDVVYSVILKLHFLINTIESAKINLTVHSFTFLPTVSFGTNTFLL